MEGIAAMHLPADMVCPGRTATARISHGTWLRLAYTGIRIYTGILYTGIIPA
jgi:hypothetical protein